MSRWRRNRRCRPEAEGRNVRKLVHRRVFGIGEMDMVEHAIEPTTIDGSPRRCDDPVRQGGCVFVARKDGQQGKDVGQPLFRRQRAQPLEQRPDATCSILRELQPAPSDRTSPSRGRARRNRPVSAPPTRNETRAPAPHAAPLRRPWMKKARCAADSTRPARDHRHHRCRCDRRRSAGRANSASGSARTPDGDAIETECNRRADGRAGLMMRPSVGQSSAERPSYCAKPLDDARLVSNFAFGRQHAPIRNA